MDIREFYKHSQENQNKNTDSFNSKNNYNKQNFNSKQDFSDYQNTINK